MLINCSCLRGEKLELIEEAHIFLEGKKVISVGDGFDPEGLDLRGFLAMPGLINAHTHIGDAFAKEACAGLRVDDAVGRKGLKWKLYRESERRLRVLAMKEAAIEMVESGVTSHADFREGGSEGLEELRDATKALPLRTIALGRNLDRKFECCSGLGLNLYQVRQQLPKTKDRKNMILALHAGEKKGEVSVALGYDPDIIVHFTHCSQKDIKEAARKKVSVVVCPRSNAALGVGFPPVANLLEKGVNCAIGTDNVMINSPDMWREMEFLYKYSALDGALEACDLLRMACVNAAKALRTDSGSIEHGKRADLIFIDRDAPNLRHSRNLLATLVSRCRHDNVRKVMIDGAFVIDKDRQPSMGRILRSNA